MFQGGLTSTLSVYAGALYLGGGGAAGGGGGGGVGGGAAMRLSLSRHNSPALPVPHVTKVATLLTVYKVTFLFLTCVIFLDF